MIRPETLDQYKRFHRACVGYGNALFRGVFGHKVFIGALLTETQHTRRFAKVRAELAMPLNKNHAASR